MTEIEVILRDPLKRLQRLYGVKDATTGQLGQFRPRAEQAEVLRLLHVEKARRLIILKSRRLGMSTALGIYALDRAIWESGLQCSIVDQSQADAESKTSKIVKPALEFMPPELRAGIRAGREAGGKSTDRAFELRVGRQPLSGIYGGKRARGGTNHVLHISEWGVIQADDLKRSEEILTGALPSAQHGTIIVETTWKGGRGGHLYSLIEQALAIPPDKWTPDDWRVVFFPWMTDPTAAKESGEVPDACREYLAGTGLELKEGQRRWYASHAWPLGEFRYREYPTTFDECFKTPMEGAIYADLIDAARIAGRITTQTLHEPRSLVWTTWDLGGLTNTVVWYWQWVAGEIRLLGCEGGEMSMAQRVGSILAKPYSYAGHLLPHDAEAKKIGELSWLGELQALGLHGCRVIPKTHDPWHGIGRMRELFPSMRFQLPGCEAGLNSLAQYHRREDRSKGYITDEIVHDWSSHAADAFRYIGEAMLHGMVKAVGTVQAETVNHYGQRRLRRGRQGMRVGG